MSLSIPVLNNVLPSFIGIKTTNIKNTNIERLNTQSLVCLFIVDKYYLTLEGLLDKNLQKQCIRSSLP